MEIPAELKNARVALVHDWLLTWRGGEKVRIWFGEPLDLSEFHGKRDSLRTHKEIADFLMAEIGELGNKDREWMSFGN